MYIEGMELPVDTVSGVWKPRIDKLKNKHDKIMLEYNKLVREYDDIISELREKYILSQTNINYVYNGECRHNNYKWQPDYWECPDCGKELNGKNNWLGKHLTEAQEQRFNKLLNAVFAVYPQFFSMYCEHEYCG